MRTLVNTIIDAQKGKTSEYFRAAGVETYLDAISFAALQTTPTAEEKQQLLLALAEELALPIVGARDSEHWYLKYEDWNIDIGGLVPVFSRAGNFPVGCLKRSIPEFTLRK